MKNNKSSIEFYKKVASNINDAVDVKLLAKNDYTHYDIEFIKKYTNKSFTLLDLGSGTGLIINKLVDNFKSITAVELFKEFSKFIIKDKKIHIVNSNLLEFTSDNKYNIITMFGTAHYFNSDESLLIYEKVYSMLENNGTFILKNQFGIKKTKTVTSSEELGDDYYAQYRELKFEIDRLESIGFTDIEIVDIYPKEANRWDDTHFYALVCKK